LRCNPCISRLSLYTVKYNLVTEENQNIQKSLIEACKKGNSTAQYALYQKYSKAMYNLAFRIVNNREDAEDMLQEAFTDAFRKLGSYRFESTFGAWLKTIVINRCINHLKKKSREIITDKVPEIQDTEIIQDSIRLISLKDIFPD